MNKQNICQHPVALINELLCSNSAEGAVSLCLRRLLERYVIKCPQKAGENNELTHMQHGAKS
jgi:hypothetical protein